MMVEQHGKCAIFFDRDDTLIRNVPYNGDPRQVVLMPGAVEACQTLKDRGFELFVVSNQSGVGRGLITIEDVTAVNARMLELLGARLFTDILCCYDIPDIPETCRKPSPKLIFQAQKKHNLNLSNSVLIGDQWSDIRAGQRAGCYTILLNHQRSSNDLKPAQITATFVAASLAEAAEWICTHIDVLNPHKSNVK